jgi:DNA polymerase III delta subunit
VPRKPFSEGEVPSFGEAPSVVLIIGDVEFFVGEAAAKAAASLSGEDAEVLRFEDEAPAEAVSDALLNRSLFSARRVVQFDVSRLLGTETPATLLDAAVEAWETGTPSGRRDAFRRARALISALDLPAGAPAEELAEGAARKTRRKAQQDVLLSILRELPEEKGSPRVLRDAIAFLLDRGNDGTVALVTATSPPPGVDLLEEIAKKGLVLEASVGKGAAGALTRLARALAKEREVSLEPQAIDRLLLQTDSDPELFSSELLKLLQWAGPGGRVRAADVRENVDDDSSEDIYAFYDAIGRREAGEALSRLERLFSDRAVRSGDWVVKEKEKDESWPVIFLGMLTGEVRRMLLIRSRMEESGGGPDASQNYNAFQARVVPRLAEPVAPFGRSPFENKKGAISGFLWFKAAARAARYSTPELARALARAADVDVRLKSSVPPLDALSVYVAQLIAGS